MVTTAKYASAKSVELDEVQGNLLQGYNMHYVTHLIVRLQSQSGAKEFVRDVTSGHDDVPQITTARRWGTPTQPTKPATCLNVGMTATGLRAFGIGDEDLNTFPEEFVEGAAARANKVGDVGTSAPSLWRHNLGDPEAAHVMWTVHGATSKDRDETVEKLIAHSKTLSAFSEPVLLHGEGLPDATTGQPGYGVHFGYQDSISQPRFVVNGEVYGRANRQATVPVGALLQGYDETSFANVKWQQPVRPDLSQNSCFNAFRVLEQHVQEFESFLENQAAALGWNKEYLAAKLMGRWRNGVPITQHHDAQYNKPGAGMPPVLSRDRLDDFDYPDVEEGANDLEGVPCPIGAHIRRGNPRGSRIVQRSANGTRPIVRRGIPYGPAYDPDAPAEDPPPPRGLLGNFFCGSLLGQYESMMYDWINLGLQDPRITGTNDPIIGANNTKSSRFDIPISATETKQITGFPRFTDTVGSLYLWVLSMRGLRHLSHM